MITRIVPLDLIFAYVKKGKHVGSRDKPALLPVVCLRPDMAITQFILKIIGFFSPHARWHLRRYSSKISDEGKCQKESEQHEKKLCWRGLFKKPIIRDLNRDRLIVSEGIEVCCIAKTLRKTWIRVRMSKEIYRKWDNRPTDRLQDVISRTHRNAFYNPIMHKDFRKVKISRPDSTRLDRIRIILGPIGEGLTGLDIGCNMGYMSHHLQRQGFEMTGLDFDEYHLLLAKALNETYSLTANFVKSGFNEFNPDKEYDIVLAFTVLYHIFFRQKDMNPIDIAKKVGSLAKSALFWESGDQPEKEKKLILSNSGLTKYLSLGTTKGTGLKRELGIFLRPDTALSRTLLARYKAFF